MLPTARSSRVRFAGWVTVFLGLGLVLAACSSASTGDGSAASSPPSGPAGPPGSATASAEPSPTTAAPARPVHVSLFQGDGQVLGVGFAIIAQFDRAPTDSRAFTHAATVTVNGRPAGGAWYWQKSGEPGVAIEALYRPRDYWPAHAHIEANFPLKGLSAGRGLAYDDSLTLSIRTVCPARLDREQRDTSDDRD